MSPATRRRVRPVFALVALVVALLGLFAGAAHAQDLGSFCKEPPAPEFVGDGQVGKIDPPTIDRGEPGTPYGNYGYAGMVWHTYDTGCAGDPAANIDTSLGSWLFDAAKFVVATTSGIHWLQQNDGALGAIDGLVADVSSALYENVFVVWSGLALALAGIAILWMSIKGNLAQVGTKTLAVLAGLTFAAATYMAPVTYSTIVDDLLGDGVEQLQDQLLDTTGTASYNALPQLLHENVVYQPWLEGEFGDKDSPAARQHGEALLAAQACDKWQTMSAQEGGAPCPVDEKNAEFERIAGELEDTPAHETFTGAGQDRVGAGAGSLISALCYASFQLLCLLAVFVAQLLIRMIVLFGPIIGAVAIVWNTILYRVLQAAGLAIGYAVALAAISAAHVLMMQWILAPEREGVLTTPGQLVLAALITIVLWIAVKPHRKLHHMIGSGLKLAGVETLPWEQIQQRRMMRRLRRQNERHHQDEQATRWDIANNAERPENEAESDPGTVWMDSTRTQHVPSQRMDQRGPALAAAGARPDSGTTGGSLGTGSSGPPRNGGPSAPRSGGTGTAARTGPGEAGTSHGGMRTSLPSGADAGPTPADEPPPAAEEPRSSGSGPVLRPSEHWGRGHENAESWRTDDRAERDIGPANPAPSYHDGDSNERVYRVYRPSTGATETGSDDPDPTHRDRPEAQE